MGALRERLDAHRAAQDARAAALDGGAPATRDDSQPPAKRIEPVLVRLADVRPEAIDWLWPGRLARGKVTLLVGDPGLGKSYITIDVAARVSSGLAWPDGAPGRDSAAVLMLSAEDGLADTIRPRLDAAGADCTRVHHLAVLRCAEEERSVRLADIDGIEQAIEATSASVITIDPVSAYTGTTDTHRDSEVRGLMAPLAALAERTGVAVLGVMHLGKSTQRAAIYRTAGSIAFTAAARIVLAVASDPSQDGRRILAPIKSNLSRPPAALAYSLADGRLAWQVGDVDIDIQTLLDGPPTGRDHAEQTDAEQVIADLLADVSTWPMDATAAIKAGKAHGIHERTMQRTARNLGIRIARIGFGRGGRWVWQRPAIGDSLDDIAADDVGVSSMSPMGQQAAKTTHTHIDDTETVRRECGAGDAKGTSDVRHI